MENSVRRFAVAIVESVLAIVFIGALQSSLATFGVLPSLFDFRVVYCGERAVIAHRDPYLTEPLRSCEHTFPATRFQEPWTVTPYPLPGYSAAFLLPFGLLPVKIAKFAWLASLVLTFGVASAATAAIVRARPWIVAAICAPTLGFLDLTYGEPVNISIGAVALAALALERDRPRLAALAAAVAMIEPHVGLPACLALFVFVPRTRAVLCAAGAGFAALSVATVGLATSLEYVTTFLPLQARAEVYAVDQYSLTHALALAGVAPGPALLLGNIGYVCAIAFGLFAAARLTKLGQPRALLILVPVATAMLGGPFIHDVEIAAALPAAIVLSRRSAVARAAVSLLAVEWGWAWRGLVVMVTASALGLASLAMPDVTVRRRIIYALGVVSCVILLNTMLVSPEPPLRRLGPLPVTVTADTPSPVAWEWTIRLSSIGGNLSKRAAAIKVPTWIGLALVPLSFLELELALVGSFRRTRARGTARAAGADARSTS